MMVDEPTRSLRLPPYDASNWTRVMNSLRFTAKSCRIESNSTVILTVVVSRERGTRDLNLLASSLQCTSEKSKIEQQTELLYCFDCEPSLEKAKTTHLTNH